MGNYRESCIFVINQSADYMKYPLYPCSLFIFGLCLMALPLGAQSPYRLVDPYSDLWMTLGIGADSLAMKLEFRNEELMHASGLDLLWYDQAGLARRPRTVDSVWTRAVDSTLVTPHHHKAQVRDYYRALHLRFAEGVDLELRAYASGVAFRWIPRSQDSIFIERSYFSPRLEGDFTFYTQPKDQAGNFSYTTPVQAMRIDRWLSELSPEATLPLLIERPDRALLLMAQAHQQHMPTHAYQVLPDSITRLVPYFEANKAPAPTARVSRGQEPELPTPGTLGPPLPWGGNQPLPWQVMMVSPEATGFLNEDLPYLLNPPAQGNFNWVKRGHALWPGGNGWNLIGADFRTGCNQTTYEAYLDFALYEGFDYLVVDSLYQPNELGGYQQNPKLQLSQLSNRLQGQDLGLIATLSAEQVRLEQDLVLPDLGFWGVKGIWLRGVTQQQATDRTWLLDLIEACAEQQLLLMLDDGVLPDGLQRTYPHVLSTGGMRYADPRQVPDATGSQPDHHVALSYLRLPMGAMLTGIGAMEHAGREDYHPQFLRPVAAGTRCHQLAMAVIYDLPLHLLTGLPQQYLAEPVLFDFYRNLPQQWERVIPQEGRVDGYAVVAKRSGNIWYVAALNDWTPREVTLDLSFLPEGRYRGTLYLDGINADRRGEEYRIERRPVDQGKDPEVRLASGGGAVIVIRPLE